MDKIIEINNLTKNYGNHRGVTDVSLCVNKGDVFGFLGPNGAGKSTTIRSMLGLINFTQGEIRICGMDVRKKHREILQRIGYMPSECWFYQGTTVLEILKMSAAARQIQCDEYRNFLCEKLNLDVSRKISELSLGNRKKVSVVCAMQHRPELLIFDEPTSGLDPLIQKNFFELIYSAVDDGATCLLSTHVLSEVRTNCNRVAIMKEGKVLCTDTVENLTRANSKRIKGIVDGESVDYLFSGDYQKLFAELSTHDIYDISIEEPSMEEIFMHYYGGK